MHSFFTPNFITIFSTIRMSFTVFTLSPPFSFLSTNSCTIFSLRASHSPNAGRMWFSSTNT